MTFEEHLELTRGNDGAADASAAEDARADEIAAELLVDGSKRMSTAKKAAQAERARWEAKNGAELRKQFTQLQFEDLDFEAQVPIGESTYVRLGDMDALRIRVRKDLRTDAHRSELRAFDTEMEFWNSALKMLLPGKTIGESMVQP